MKVLLPLAFAGIAALGNAIFVLGQTQSQGAGNKMLIIAASAVLAGVLAMIAAPFTGPVHWGWPSRDSWRVLAFSGIGLFITYLGFNLLYSRFGATQYALYAVISILTTTVLVGAVWLREPLSPSQIAAVALAVASIVLFSAGQS
jgi:drug/metabolite transporter (DMT)-like permease